MTTLGTAVVVQLVLSVIGAEEASYAKAHEQTTRTGQPMLVLVGAQWCPACVQMKNSIVPELKKREVFSKVSFAEVDIDQQRELGSELTKGGPIPQLLMYRRTPLGWRLRRIIGGQSIQQVESFISEGLVLNEQPQDP